MKNETIPASILLTAWLAIGLGLSACSQAGISGEKYPDGARKSQSAFLRLSEADSVRHGLQMEWYPSGAKASLETFVHGYRQGYSLRWYPDGKMKSVEHFTDGIRDGQAKSWDGDGRLVACSTPEGDCLRAASDGASDDARFASRPQAR